MTAQSARRHFGPSVFTHSICGAWDRFPSDGSPLRRVACIFAVMITDESSLAEIAASASGARGKKTSPQRSPVSTPQRTKWRNVSLEVLGSDRSLNLGNIPVFPGGPSVGDRAMDTPVPESQDSAFSFGENTMVGSVGGETLATGEGWEASVENKYLRSMRRSWAHKGVLPIRAG